MCRAEARPAIPPAPRSVHALRGGFLAENSMKKTAQENILMVPATLVPVITDIAAEAGDHLMIINNVCVGVYTGKISSSPSSPAKDDKGDGPSQQRATVTRQESKTGRTARNSRSELVTPTSVLKVIKQQSNPIGAREIGDAIGLERTDLVARGRVSRFLGLAVKRGKIINVSEPGKIQTYTLNQAEDTHQANF